MTSDHTLVLIRPEEIIDMLTGILLISAEELLDLVTNFTFWHLDVVLGGTIIRHHGQETIIGDVELGTLSVPLVLILHPQF